MRTLLIRCMWGAVGLVSAGAVLAADATGDPSISHALRQDSPVELPGFGRVLLAFAITLAVGVGSVYALRRWLPKLAQVNSASNDLRVIARANVHAALRVHVIEVAGRKVLVAEGKNGIAMTVMPDVENRPSESGTGPLQS